MADTEATAGGTWQGTLSSLIFALIVAGVVLLFFACCTGRFLEFYYPRVYRESLSISADGKKTYTRMVRREANVAEPPRNGVLRLLYPVTLWLCACRHRPTERYELLNKAGLDAHVFYLFLRRMIYFFIITFFLGIIVAAVNASKGDAFADQLFRFSTDRLPQESSALWTHYVMLVLQAAVLIVLLQNGYNEYLRQRFRWLAVVAPSQRTLLVTGLPTTGPSSSSPTARGSHQIAAAAAAPHLAESMLPNTSHALPSQGIVCGPESTVAPSITGKSMDVKLAHLNALVEEFEVLQGQIRFLLATRKDPAKKPYGIFGMLQRYCFFCCCCIRKGLREQNAATAGSNPAIAGAPATQSAPTLGDKRWEDVASAEPRIARKIARLRAALARQREMGVDRTGKTVVLPGQSKLPADERLHRIAYADTAFVTFQRPGVAQHGLSGRRLHKGTGRILGSAHGNVASAQPHDRVYSEVLQAYGVTSVPGAVHAYSAPDPDDVVWSNMDLTRKQRTIRSFIATVLLTIVLIIAFAPAVFAAALTSLGPLGQVIGFLEPVLNWGGLSKGLIQSLLPALLVTVFLALLLTIVRAIAKFSGARSESNITLYAIDKLFSLKVINAVLAITIATTVLSSLDAIINDPSSVLTLLGRYLPQASGFFTSFVILQVVSSLPMGLLRPVGVILYCIKRRGAVTQRQLDTVRRGTYMGVPYEDWAPMAALILAIGQLYCFYNPIIIIPVLAYFVLVSMFVRHQILYVHASVGDMGGRAWPLFVQHALDGMLLQHVVWTAYFFIRKVDGAGYAMIPVLIICFLFRYYFRELFDRPSQMLSPAAVEAIEAYVRAGRGGGSSGTPAAANNVVLTLPGHTNVSLHSPNHPAPAPTPAAAAAPSDAQLRAQATRYLPTYPALSSMVQRVVWFFSHPWPKRHDLTLRDTCERAALEEYYKTLDFDATNRALDELSQPRYRGYVRPALKEEEEAEVDVYNWEEDDTLPMQRLQVAAPALKAAAVNAPMTTATLPASPSKAVNGSYLPPAAVNGGVPVANGHAPTNGQAAHGHANGGLAPPAAMPVVNGGGPARH